MNQAPAEEYWHISPDTADLAGPFDTVEDAQADAETILHDRTYAAMTARIVKTVSLSCTKVTYETTWTAPDAL